MTRYMIWDIAEATDTNENFKGEVRRYLIGKPYAKDVSCVIDIDEQGTDYIEYVIKSQGYTRKCDAVRALKKWQELADWEDGYGNWKHQPVIIRAFEV